MARACIASPRWCGGCDRRVLEGRGPGGGGAATAAHGEQPLGRSLGLRERTGASCGRRDCDSRRRTGPAFRAVVVAPPGEANGMGAGDVKRLKALDLTTLVQPDQPASMEIALPPGGAVSPKSISAPG